MNNYHNLNNFSGGIIEDARLFGDGYDFQVSVLENNFLIEVKGIRSKNGYVRLTQNEFNKAREYKENYFLTIISDLDSIPKITLFSNPLEKIEFVSKTTMSKEQTFFASKSLVL